MQKSRLMLLSLGALCALLVGCSDPIADASGELELSFFDEAQPVSYSVLASSFVTLDQSTIGNDALTERQNHTFKDQEAFADFWQQLHANISPAPALPEVDFAHDMVVAVVLGLRSSGGYAVEVKQVATQNDQVGVHVLETAPGSECVTPSVMTSPYHLVKMSATASPISFVDTKTVRSCGS